MAIRFRVSVIARKLVISFLSSSVVQATTTGPGNVMRWLCQNPVRINKSALATPERGFASEKCRHVAGDRKAMLRGRLIWRGVAASMVTVPLMAVAQPVDVQPPSPATAMRAWNQIEPWIRAWSVPEEAPEGLPVAHVATVTLRLGGVVLATETVVNEDAGVLQEVVRKAIDAASERLPIEGDVFLERRTLDAAQRISMSLELGGALVPMSEQTDFERELGTNPGLDGVAVRYNGQVEAMSPGEMLARGTTPGSALNIVRGRVVGEDASLVLQPDRMQGATYYRFTTTHMAQNNALSAPTFLHRGGRIVTLPSVDQDMLRSFADDMSSFLVRRQWPGTEQLGMQGTLKAHSGRFDPPFAGPLSQALSAYALCRYATTPGVSPEQAAAAREFAARLLSQLSVVEDVEVEPWATPADAAMCTLAIIEAERAMVPLDEQARTLSVMCRRQTWLAYSPDAGFDPSLPTSGYGLIAAALVRSASTDDERAIASAAVRATYQVTPPDQLAAQMPWLGWAELELAGPRQIPAGVALRDMRAGVWQNQFTSADAQAGDEDLVGGIVLTAGGMSPLPSWHTARRVAFLATMLADERLTDPNEFHTELVSLLRSLRFLRQLCVDDALLYMCRSPMWAVGGIRSSLWDQSMPPDATAFTLLTVTETLRALDGR